MISDDSGNQPGAERLDENEREAHRQRLALHFFGVIGATTLSIGVGSYLSLHSYNALFRLDRFDRLGNIDHKLSAQESLSYLFSANFLRVVSFKNVMSTILRKVPPLVNCCCDKTASSFVGYLVCQFLRTNMSYPFELMIHRFLLPKEVVGDLDNVSYFRGMFLRYIGKICGDVSRVAVEEVFLFCLLMTFSDPTNGQSDGDHTNNIQVGSNDAKKLEDFTARRSWWGYLCGIASNAASYLVSNKFYTKSLGFQLGKWKQTNCFDFSCLPERHNTLNIILLKILLNGGQDAFEMAMGRYSIYGATQILLSTWELWKENIATTFNEIIEGLDDENQGNANENQNQQNQGENESPRIEFID